jgi:putative GTP pyrophosphokinase
VARAQRTATAKRLASWGQEFEEVRPTYEALVGRLETLFEDLLARRDIDIAQMEGRAKSVESFIDKIKRKGTYRDPLKQVTDLAGLRVITYTLQDIEKVGELIGAEFTVDEERSVVKPEVPDPDRFGYVATHYIAQICPPRSELEEWAAFGERLFEIQVRTVLQHAWAAIDHKLNYKSRTEVPRDLQRQLFRVSALLEVADEHFDEVERQSQSLSEEYGVEIQRGNLDSLAIDAASVDVYLRAHKVAERWAPRIVRAALEVDLDKQHLERDRRDLLSAIQRAQINTIGELDAVLQDAERWGDHLLQEIHAASEKEDDEAFGGLEITVDDALCMFVLYGTLASQDAIDQVGWLPPTPQTLKKLIAEAKQPGRKRAGSPARPRPPQRRS